MGRFNFVNLAKERKTTYEFTSKAVSRKDVRNILEAACWAPSAHNAQPWKFIVVRSRKTIADLMALCAYGAFHTQPSLIIALVQTPHNRCFCPMEVYDHYICLGMAAVNMCYAAHCLGVQSCLISPERKAKKLLHVPGACTVPLLVGFGYEKKGVYQKIRTRNLLEDVVFRECYGKK